MSDFKKFQSSLIEELLPFIQVSVENYGKELNESFKKDLLGIGDSSVIGDTPSQREVFIGNLFRGYMEIYESYTNLSNIGLYIRRFPYRGAGVTKGAYLRYHIENYFHELYILRERLDRYLTVIKRAYRKDPEKGRIDESIDLLRKTISKAFAGVAGARGRHVHERRYDDPELGRLSLSELLASRDDTHFQTIYEWIYREIRKAKLVWIKHNNESIEALLNTCFGVLRSLLFDKQEKMKLPLYLEQRSILPNKRAALDPGPVAALEKSERPRSGRGQ